MSQSAVDLPDPLEGPAGRAASNPDDLLAQLAGEEIDRMLADSENGSAALSSANTDLPPARKDKRQGSEASRPETTPAITEPAGAEARSERDPTQAALDDLFGQLQAPDPAVAIPAATANEEASSDPSAAQPAAQAAPEITIPPAIEDAGADKPEQSQQLPQMARNEVEVETGATTEEQAKQPLPEPAPPSAAAELAAEMDADERQNAQARQRMSEPPDPAIAEMEKELVSAEQESTGTVEEPAPAAADQATPAANQEKAAEGAESSVVIDESAIGLDESEGDQDQAEAPAPLAIRVLEGLNAPWAGWSDRTRSTMGKVAIVTMLNAIAVLVYVLLFRKH